MKLAADRFKYKEKNQPSSPEGLQAGGNNQRKSAAGKE